MDKNVNNNKNDKKGSNHFNVTINQSNKDTYEAALQLKKELGCNLSDLVYYGLQLTLKPENRPKRFGLSM